MVAAFLVDDAQMPAESESVNMNICIGREFVSGGHEHYNAQRGQSWRKPSNYDLCINSSSLSVEQTADAILRVLEKWKEGKLI